MPYKRNISTDTGYLRKKTGAAMSDRERKFLMRRAKITPIEMVSETIKGLPEAASKVFKTLAFPVTPAIRGKLRSILGEYLKKKR